MSKDFDELGFHKTIARYHISLAVLLALGGILAAAGIAFLTTGATEVNHSFDALDESHNRMFSAGVSFVGSGALDLSIGIMIILISGTVISYLLKKSSFPVQSKVLENVEQPVSLEINQQEEKIKNLKILTEIENLKVDLANLKLEAAALKLEQSKTSMNNPRPKRVNKKSN